MTIEEAKVLPSRTKIKTFEAGQRFIFMTFEKQISKLVAHVEAKTGKVESGVNPPFFFLEARVSSNEVFSNMEKAKDQSTDEFGFRVPSEETPEQDFIVKSEPLTDFWSSLNSKKI